MYILVSAHDFPLQIFHIKVILLCKILYIAMGMATLISITNILHEKYIIMYNIVYYKTNFQHKYCILKITFSI